jgi:hypothetical protein
LNRFVKNGTPMRKLFLLGTAAALLVGTAVAADHESAPIPNFNPDGETGWSADRPASDDYLPHDKSTGPGPVESDPAHPYVPNGQGQSTYRIADLTNPILKPWVVAQMKKTNDDVLAGKVPFIARERCWPGGLPTWDIYNRGQPVHIFQAKDQVILVNELYGEARRVYLNLPHSKNPKPSWYGESVGHYEGDTLVVDTIGLNNKTHVDNYRTPHTEKLHVVERWKMIEGGKTLQVTLAIDDPETYNQPWMATQRYQQAEGPMLEEICAEGNLQLFDYGVPVAKRPDF